MATADGIDRCASRERRPKEIRPRAAATPQARAEEALQDESPELPDFIIAEYNLPGMSGLEFLEEARKSERLGQIPVLIAYNGRDVGDIESILQGEVEEVILSPFSSVLIFVWFRRYL